VTCPKVTRVLALRGPGLRSTVGICSSGGWKGGKDRSFGFEKGGAGPRMPPARERAWPADARGDGKLMHSGGGRGLTVAFLRGPPGCWGANSRAHPRRCACGLRRRAQGRAHAPRVRRARPRPASGLARSRTRRAPARAARRSPSPPLPSPPRPRPGTLAGPERERRRHLSCCRCLQRSGALRREGARGGARGPASRRPRRRLLLGLRCSPRHEAAGLGLPGPRSPSRAPPCRSLCRPGPAAAPGARAMLRRPAPALAPAAWLLLAGLLCGGCGRVWAARGKRRSWAGPRGFGPRVRGSGQVGRGVQVWASQDVGTRCGCPGESGLGPGRGTWAVPIAPQGWWLRGLGVLGEQMVRGGRAVHPPGGMLRRGLRAQMRIKLGVHAQFLACAYISAHSSAALFAEIPFFLLLHGGHHDFAPFCRLPESFKRCLFPGEWRLKLLAPSLFASLPPFHPKVKS
jgi:hypothetical protein